MKLPDEEKKLREYILGEIGDEERSTAERRLMTDDDYFQKLSMMEEDLIQDYVDGNLDAAEREKFENRFLLSEENRQKVKFARALRKYVNETEYSPEPNKKSDFFDSLKAFFSIPVIATLIVLISLGAAGLFVWQRSSTNDSEVLIALNKAYKNDRPTEARITGFHYAPKIEGTRGNNKNENLDLVFAKSRATESVLKNETAENLHELGRVYLAENNFDEAVKLFEKALKKNSNIAKIHNDLGVALMEKAKLQNEGKLENLAKASEEIERAIELDNNLREAYFNRGLVIESLKLPNQAKEAWENYLKLDSVSQWANEVRQRLQKMETNKSVNQTKEEVLQDFLQAKQANDTERAWYILSRNREIITGRLIPQQLTFLFVDNKANGNEIKAQEALNALKYTGKLDEERSGDLFWRNVADYYSEVASEKALLLKKAHDSLFRGYESSIKNDFSKALREFESASQLFLQTGNVWQRQISNYYITNCLGFKDKKSDETENERIKMTNEILKFSQERSYKWLELLAMMRITSLQNEATQYSKALNNAEKSYMIAKNLENTYEEQKILGMLVSLYALLGNKKKAIDYTQKIFEVMDGANNSLRQKWRNYFSASELFVSVRNFSAAKLIVKEEVLVADQIGEAGVLSTSQTHAGKILIISNDFIEARELLNKGIENAQKLPNEKARKNLVAYSLLKLADLEQELGNHEESARLYDQSYQVNDSPYFEFEIQKGRLRSFLAVGNDSELERQIPKTIQIAEENRLKILEEEQSNSFFHNESSVFDTAIEWEFGRGNFQKAYDYAEGASARSLLDLLERNKSSKHTSPNETAYSLVKATPLKLNEIQAQIPEETQLLQYTVLDKKVLIWLVTKDKLIVKQLPVSLEDLQNKVERFINLILEDKKEVSQETIQLSKELFSLLVQPIYEELDKKKQICLIPNKVLFFLPFSALLSSEEKFFLEEFVIFYAPSANIFIHCTKNAEKKADQTSESILSIGNPSFDTVVFSDLSSLEFAEIEAKNIAKLYDKSTVLLNKAATKRAFHQNISNADVLHFAGHYIVKPDMPLLSSLLFAKEGEEPEQSSLTNGELYSENLNHLKLVILSSCETGVESYLNGEGMIGLSRTFLAMNTPIVVASQWKVDSEATAILMNKFHHFRRQQKLPTAVALRKAQLEMLNDNKFKTPYYWSAFASFGGYSKF